MTALCSCLCIYAILYGIGEILYSNWLTAVASMTAAALSGIATFNYWKRISDSNR